MFSLARSVFVLPALAFAILICVMGSCAALAQSASVAPNTSGPAAVESLMAAAAEDFTAPTSTRPVAISKARMGYVAEGGTGRYLLCGSFTSAQEKGAQWIQFATIKTSPYEQWTAGMAEAQCANKRIKWYGGDHASELVQRIRSG